MVDIDNSLNVLCVYIRKYRFQLNNGSNVSYNDLTPQSLGSFKGKPKYKESADSITAFINNNNQLLNKEFSVNNLSNILALLFIVATKNNISDSSFLVLSDLINGVCFGNKSIDETIKTQLKQIKTEILSRFRTETENIDSQIIDATQSQSNDRTATPPNEQLPRPIIQQDTQLQVNRIPDTLVHMDTGLNVNVNINDLSSIIRQIIKEEVNISNKSATASISTQDQTANSINKKTLTRVAYSDLRQSVLIRYEKLMKIENTVALFTSHLENNTVPYALSFVKFPAPLWCDDPVFVDAHNEIIRKTQIEMVKEIISRGKTVIECLNVEIAELRSKLDNTYDGNKDKFFDNIKATASNNLKTFFESSNAKLLRLQNNYFEDQINTVYEVKDTISDDYVNKYLQLNTNDDLNNEKRTDSNKNCINQNNNAQSTAKTPKKQKYNNKSNNQQYQNNRYRNYETDNNQNRKYNGYSKRNKNDNESNNPTINNNWRNNMNANQHNNNINNNVNFQMNANQNSKT